MRVSEDDSYDFLKWVNDYLYNEERGEWDYQLREEDGTIYGWVKQEDTKRG